MACSERLKGQEEADDGQASECCEAGKKKAAQWKKPVLEDVSGKVMAQPYIRFT